MIKNQITLNHGSGGKQMHKYIEDIIVKNLKNGVLERMDDSAVLETLNKPRFAMTTDSYVVSPLFFAGGDIGRMAVSGTVNDLATSGARAHALSLAFILEEGVSLEVIETIVKSIAATAIEADVKIVTGDTKVVEKGKGDQIYINTCGIGFIDEGVEISTYNAKKDDVIIITGPIGNHEIALLGERNEFDFEIDIPSDVAPLNRKVEKLLGMTKKINVIKDPTRGGVASALHEICGHSNCEIRLYERDIPVDKRVDAVCELVGFDPLYLANEGRFIIVCPDESVRSVVESFGEETKVIGKVSDVGTANLILETKFGGERRVGMLETTQLPRIC